MIRKAKTYNGDLMNKGSDNEEIVMIWLQRKFNNFYFEDLRKYEWAQKNDIDCCIYKKGEEKINIEIKSDIHIDENKNFLFEFFRYHHFVTFNCGYMGWGCRSHADRLIIRNPRTNKIFIFRLKILRMEVGKYISENKVRIDQVDTDDQKTTFNFLIPMNSLSYVVNQLPIV